MELHDTALTLVVVIGFLIPTSTVLVALRLFVRWHNRGFGLDDALVLAGWALFIPSIALLIPAAYNGLGMRDGDFTHDEMKKALKLFFVFQILCLPAVICIRNSLIITLSRLTRSRPVLILLYFLISLNTAGTLAVVLFLILQCRPVRSNWDPALSDTHCLPRASLIAMAKAWSAVSVVVDWSVALLPIPLLWHVRMRWRVKGAVMGILGLGIFASCATLIRTPLLPSLAAARDPLRHIGAITLWAFLETGLGLLAAALTSLRPLLRRFLGCPGVGGDVLLHDDGEGPPRRRGRRMCVRYHGRWYGSGSGSGVRPTTTTMMVTTATARVERVLGMLGLRGRANGGSGGLRYGYGNRSWGSKGGRGKEMAGSSSAQDSWETMVYDGVGVGETGVGMRTVVVQGGGGVVAEDGESQRSFVREGDIKVRKSICVEVPDE